MDRNGDLILRTDAETACFHEALPAMGALYSMYPVMVLPEVPVDTHSYSSSGWCFSEICIALLGRQLVEFSRTAVHEHFPSLVEFDAVIDEDLVVKFVDAFECE